MRMLPIPLLVVLTLSACSDSAPSTPPQGGVPTAGGSEYVLTIGQEVRLDSLLSLSVTGVPADSRCPSDVQCVWAGDGAVGIAYSLGDGPSNPDTLHTTLDPRSARFGGYGITLLDLTPYPDSHGAIPVDAYAARLRVERRRD